MRTKAKHAEYHAIKMEIWSSKMGLKARVDAAAWLRCIAPEEVKQLIASEGSGRATALSAVRFYRALDEEVALLADYVERVGCELCCAVDAAATLAWLGEHRPSLRLAWIDGNAAAGDRASAPSAWGARSS
jgi:hypothetical protein